MGAIKKTLATVAATAALLGGGLATASPAAATVGDAPAAAMAQEWDGPINSWTTFPWQNGLQSCMATGHIGMSKGLYLNFRCVPDGMFTTYLWVLR